MFLHTYSPHSLLLQLVSTINFKLFYLKPNVELLVSFAFILFCQKTKIIFTGQTINCKTVNIFVVVIVVCNLRSPVNSFKMLFL